MAGTVRRRVLRPSLQPWRALTLRWRNPDSEADLPCAGCFAASANRTRCGLRMTTSDQLLHLGQFLRGRQADILAAWNGAIRDTWPHRADRTPRGAVTALLLDHIIAAVERPPAIEDFSAAAVIGRDQAGATARDIANDLALLRRVILRRLHAERSSVSAAVYEMLWVAFESVLANAFPPETGLNEQSNEALADTSDADGKRTASERRDRFL